MRRGLRTPGHQSPLPAQPAAADGGGHCPGHRARPFDPAIKSEYGYGRIPGVVTNLEFERIVCPTGPTLGSLITPGGQPVRRLAFIQCVGSRDRRFLPYCSGYCCTASIKEAMLALEHEPECEVTIFYNDIRTSGKGFEELYLRAQAAGVRFIKGLPGRIRRATMAARSSALRTRRGEGGGSWPWIWRSWRWVWRRPGSRCPLRTRRRPETGWAFTQASDLILHPLESTLPGSFWLAPARGPGISTETVCRGAGGGPGHSPADRSGRKN